MSHLNDLWKDLFDEEISRHEFKVMEGIERRLGRNDTTLVLSAILIYSTTTMLYRDENSPFVIGRTLGQAAANVAKNLGKLDNSIQLCLTLAQLLRADLTDMREAAEFTDDVLSRARRDANLRQDFPKWAYFKMSAVAIMGSTIGSITGFIILGNGFVI